jgi:hypothetical protein
MYQSKSGRSHFRIPPESGKTCSTDLSVAPQSLAAVRLMIKCNDERFRNKRKPGVKGEPMKDGFTLKEDVFSKRMLEEQVAPNERRNHVEFAVCQPARHERLENISTGANAACNDFCPG